MIAADFSDKTRYGMPFEGLAPHQMTADELHGVNKRWEQFFNENRWILESIAQGDEDLVAIGLLAVRRVLCQSPNCPDAWLVRRAKLDLLSARSWGESIDSEKRQFIRQNAPKHHDPEQAARWEDQISYQLYNRQTPETAVVDRLSYQAYWHDLDDMEQKLVQILKEEMADVPRYWNGKYQPVTRKKGQAKKRFREEVSKSAKDYALSYANVRFKFFLHFGTEEEVERERAWYDNFDPFGRLHFNRNGHYDRK